MTERPRIVGRLWAFVRGDMMAAEDLDGYPDFSTPAIMARARTDEILADYVVRVAIEERDRADGVLSGVQARAGSFATLATGLLTFAVAATAVALPPSGADLLRWLSFGLLVVTVGLLLGATLMASLSTGMGKTSSVNLERVEATGSAKTSAELKADEASVWHYAAILDEETSHRRAIELFRARQLTFLALGSAVIGLLLLFSSLEFRSTPDVAPSISPSGNSPITPSASP